MSEILTLAVMDRLRDRLDNDPPRPMILPAQARNLLAQRRALRIQGLRFYWGDQWVVFEPAPSQARSARWSEAEAEQILG